MANAVPDNLLFYFLPVGFSCWYFVISSISSDFGRMPYNAFNLQIRQFKKLRYSRTTNTEALKVLGADSTFVLLSSGLNNSLDYEIVERQDH